MLLDRFTLMRERWNAFNHSNHLLKKKISVVEFMTRGVVGADSWQTCCRGGELFNKSTAVTEKMLLVILLYSWSTSLSFKSPWWCGASHAFYSCCRGAKTALGSQTRHSTSLKRRKLKLALKYLVLQVNGKIWLQPLVLNPISQSVANSREESWVEQGLEIGLSYAFR